MNTELSETNLPEVEKNKPPHYLARAVRIFDYSYALTRGAFPTTVRLSLIHNLLNNFLPMRLGELAYPILMRRYFSQDLVASSMTLVWIRALDLHFLVLLTLVVLFFPRAPLSTATGAVLWIALVPASLWLHGVLKRVLAKRPGRVATFAVRVLDHVSDRLSKSMRIWLWTALSW